MWCGEPSPISVPQPTDNTLASAHLSKRTNGWINHCRCIDHHYETTLIAHDGFLKPTKSLY
jgi:hypothetical protein